MTKLDDNTVVVEDFSDLEEAITGDNDYKYIYLNNDITLTSGISIPLRKNGLIIDGTYNDVVHTYTDMNSATPTDALYFNSYNSSVPVMNITLQNMNVVLRNFYGIVFIGDSLYAANTTLNLIDITLIGPQAVYNNYGITNIIDCNFTIGNSSRQGEIGEVHKVNIGGNTIINHNYSGYSGFLFRGGDGQGLNILPLANVEIKCGRNLLYFEGNGDLIVGERATLKLNCPYGFSYNNANGAQNVLFDAYSNVELKRNASGGYSSIVFDKTFTVNAGSRVYFENNFSSNYHLYADLVDAVININDPYYFILRNQNDYALAYFDGNTRINIDSKQVNQWNSAPSNGDVHNLPTYSWYKDEYPALTMTGNGNMNTTTISTTNFSPDEINKLPDIKNFSFYTARVISIGTSLLLSVSSITETKINITGIISANSDIKITTPYETLYGISDNEGHFSVTMSTLLKEDDKVNLITSNLNYLYHIKTVTVVYPGELILQLVPNQINFKINNPINLNPLRYTRNPEDWTIKVYDSRVDSTPWTLSASIEEPLTCSGGHVLPNSLIFIDSDMNETILSNMPIVVYTGEDNKGNPLVTDVNWDADKGVLFTVKNVYLKNGEIYYADIDWKLEPIENQP